MRFPYLNIIKYFDDFGTRQSDLTETRPLEIPRRACVSLKFNRAIKYFWDRARKLKPIPQQIKLNKFLLRIWTCTFRKWCVGMSSFYGRSESRHHPLHHRPNSTPQRYWSLILLSRMQCNNNGKKKPPLTHSNHALAKKNDRLGSFIRFSALILLPCQCAFLSAINFCVQPDS